MPSTLNACDLRLSGVRGLALLPHRCHHADLATSPTPYISPALEPETMTALMLRYALSREEVAHQYAHALLLRLSTDVDPEEAAQLARNIVTEITNDIVTFEGEEVASLIDVALRRLIDRAEADEAFMTRLTEIAY